MPDPIASAAASPVVGAPAAPKSGFATSEFALTVVSLFVAALVAGSVVPVADSAEVEGMLDAVLAAIVGKNFIALVMAVVPVVSYIRSRGVLKALFAELQSLRAKPAPAPAEPVVVAVVVAPPAPDAFKV